MKKQRHNITREERREMRRWLFALCVTGAIMVAVPVAFLSAIAQCAW